MSTLQTQQEIAATTQIVVIGGGISGLTAAYRLDQLISQAGAGVELVLLEASPRLGGVIESVRSGDYLLERGPDAFITDKPAALELCQELDLESSLLATRADFRGALVVRRGRPVPVPASFQLLGPARIGPVLRSPLFSWRAKLRMAFEPWVSRGEEEIDESVASFVRRRLGHEALDRLVQPLVGGIYTGDPDTLSLQSTLPRFKEMERIHGSLWRGLRDKSSDEDEAVGARYGLFASLSGGLSELVEAITSRISPRCQFRFGAIVRSVTRNDSGGYRIELAGGEQFACDGVVLATDGGGDLLAELDSRLAENLAEISRASSCVVSTGHRLDDIDHPLDAFGLVVPACENRRILAVSFSSRKFVGRAAPDRVLLRTFVGGALQPGLLDQEDDQLVAMVLEELGSLLGVRGRPELVDVARHSSAMPQYTVGHDDRVAEIESRLTGHVGLALAGNTLHGIGLPDCIASGAAAAETIFAGLSG